MQFVYITGIDIYVASYCRYHKDLSRDGCADMYFHVTQSELLSLSNLTL